MEASRRRPDPGAVFDYEDQRYVLGHLRAPHDDGEGAHEPGLAMATDEVITRMRSGGGPYSDLLPEVVGSVLGELNSQGLATEASGAWKMTDKGFDALTGPNGFESPPMTPQRVEALLAAGQLTNEEVELWAQASGQSLPTAPDPPAPNGSGDADAILG